MAEEVRRDQQTTYYWKYDNGSYGFIVIHKDAEAPSTDSKKSKREHCVDYGTCKNKDMLKAKLAEFEKQCEDSNYDFSKKHIPIRNGLEYISEKDYPDCEEGDWDELTQFLNSCGTAAENKCEVLRLFSGVLSGYCAQMVLPLMQEDSLTSLLGRAPILTVSSSEKTFNTIFDFTTRAMRSLIMPTHNKGKLHTECSAFLPQSLDQSEIGLRTFMRFQKEKAAFPAQLRDTAVLIYGRFFPANEIYTFIERNRWVTCVLFDPPSKVYRAPVVRLETSFLACTDFGWDVDAVARLVGRFIVSLSKLQKKKGYKKKLKKRLKRLEGWLFRYCAQHGVQGLSPSDNYFTMLQMLTLELFLDSCKDNEIIDKSQRQQVRADWFNLLLPGCTQFLTQNEETITEEMQAEEKSLRDVEGALQKMFAKEDSSRFLVVDKTEDCPETNPEDPSFKYLGYLRPYNPKAKAKPPFPALLFREQQFEKMLHKYLGKNANAPALIKNLRECKPEYLFPTPKCRFCGDPEGALIFIVEKMDFLPQETIDDLLAKLEPFFKTH